MQNVGWYQKLIQSKTEAVEMDFLRQASRVPRLEHIPNKEIGEQIGVIETIFQYI